MRKLIRLYLLLAALIVIPSHAALPDKKSPIPLSIKDIIQKRLPSTVTIVVKKDKLSVQGSGAVIQKQGVIVTCYHVIEGLQEGTVQLSNGKILDIQYVLSVDPIHDVAIISVPEETYPVTPIGDESKVELGDEILVIGSPMGLKPTVSPGIISSVKKSNQTFQFTAPISHGSSGGPLFNRYSELIGIVTSYYAAGQNLNFAVSVSTVKKLLSDKEVILAKTPGITLQKSLETAFERFKKQAAGEPGITLETAEYHLKRGEADKTLELLKDDSPSERTNYLRAKAYLLKNEADKALALFETLPDAYFRKEPRLYLYQASLFLDKKNMAQAKQALDKYNVFCDEKDAVYYYTLGDLAVSYAFSESRQLDQNQYFEKAIGFYKIAQEKDLKFVSALYKKGLVELTMGDLAEANQTYKTLLIQDKLLAGQLEASILNYATIRDTARINYQREFRKEQLMTSLSILTYGILAILADSGY